MPHHDPASYFGPEAARRSDDQTREDEADAACLLADLAFRIMCRLLDWVSLTAGPDEARALDQSRSASAP